MSRSSELEVDPWRVGHTAHSGDGVVVVSLETATTIAQSIAHGKVGGETTHAVRLESLESIHGIELVVELARLSGVHRSEDSDACFGQRRGNDVTADHRAIGEIVDRRVMNQVEATER